MKTLSEDLIQDLIERTRQTLNATEILKQEPFDLLNWKPAPERWSVLECIEHLNLYGDFYLPEIARRIRESQKPAEPYFKPGLLGDYFAKSMLPREKLNKMKTFADKNPNASDLTIDSMDRFISQQKELLVLLNKSRSVSLSKTKTAISISKLITLRLGDTFRVVIYHNQRHLVQANKVLNLQAKPEVVKA
ncbi:DinB family protein [Marinoscillum sp.]|uniref:DinB family protein n=1 Tax=Marinoscillum sp. TaxID=2024838 RepID=UPI003BAAC83A